MAAGKSRFQLQALIVSYHVLDTISLMKAEVIQSRMNSIFAQPPTGSLAEILVSIRTTTPRPWLAVRRMIPDLPTSVLYAILNILSDALLCTNNITQAKLSESALTAGEHKVMWEPFYDCINVRKLILVLLRDEIRIFIDRSTFPNSQATLTMTPQKLNGAPRNDIKFIESKAIPAQRQRSTGHLAACIARECTFYPPDTFGGLVPVQAPSTRSYCSGNLSTISLCHLY